MKDYNGFTGAERQAVSNIQFKAIKEGRMPRAEMCEICWQVMGLIMYHNEDYDLAIEGAHPICVECHMKLHARFFKPQSWANHLQRVRAGYMSKPYKSVGAYFGATRGKQDEPCMEEELDRDWFDEQNPEHWYERLKGSPINFRALSPEEQARIR